MVLDRLEKIVSFVDTSTNIQQRAVIVCKTFDNEFTMKEKIEHDANVLNNMCKNIRNDIETLNV